MEKAGNTMWKDTVNANCMRARVMASKPSNIADLRYVQSGDVIARKLQR
ncbi:Uncharacterised protein [Mycobacterium tuberculosis]|nr:Uncharacterised protein [Mycobacterium tuberculosis]